MRVYGLYFLITFSLIALGCVKSPSGTVAELVVIKPPTFSGQASRIFSVPSNIYVLNGECDVNGVGIQYSLDQTTWTDIAAGCVSGQFQIQVSLVLNLDVYVRTLKKAGFTSSAHARLNLVRPPTSSSFQLVTSGAAGQETMMGTQNAVEANFTKSTMTNGSITLKPSLIDTIYE
jgi:hypothetical protein